MSHSRAVLVTWVLLLASVGGLAATSAGTFSTEFEIPGTESQRASELIAERTPGAKADAASGEVVFAAPDGESLRTPEREQAIAETARSLAEVPKVADASDPAQAGGVSGSGRIALSNLSFTVNDQEVEEAQTTAIRRATAPARDAGLQVEYGGAAAAEETHSSSTEVAGVLIAFVVLAITFGSLLAAGMPLLTGIFGVALGLIGVTASTALFDLTDTAQSLVVMLGLAVGIDYTLFVISRHRNQVGDGMELRESIARAVGTAGSAVVFAGATVIIALVALAVTGIPFLTQMGISAAATVAIAVLLSLTFVPALLSLMGSRATKGKVQSERPPTSEARTSMGARWAGVVTRHRVAAIAIPLVALTALAAPALDMRLGLPNDGSGNPDTTERQAYDLVSQGFGPGTNGALAVVADLEGAQDPRTAGERITADLRGLDDVTSVSPAQLNERGDLAIVNVVPRSGPSSEQTQELVEAVRDRAGPLASATGAEIRVTGETATNIDISQRVGDALIPFLGVIVGLALVLLVLAFRSVLVPLTAIGGFLITIAASFGAATLVFQEGVAADALGVAQTGPLVSLLPTLVIGVIFGLSMDYQVFLVSRMREEFTHGTGAQDAVREGFRHGARVVTAAAMIMVAVFGGFVFTDDPVVKSFGLAFAVGVLIDAFLIRMTVIPALMSLLGDRAWWLPRWADRVLPDVDIEGAQLDRPRPAPTAAPVGVKALES